MQARWDNVFSDTSNDIDAVYSNWFTVFSGIVDNFIPQRTVTIRPKNKCGWTVPFVALSGDVIVSWNCFLDTQVQSNGRTIESIEIMS